MSDNNVVEAKAHLMGAGKPVTIKDLEKIKTPESTETWKPVPHAQVPQIITKMVKDHGWSFIGGGRNEAGAFTSPFKMMVSEDDNKLFGVCIVQIEGIEDNEIQIAIGFRNSHDKSLALRIAAGAKVGVCSNLVMTGDIQVKRIHKVNISVEEAVSEAFNMIPQAGKNLLGWMNGLKEIKISDDAGVSFLAKAVEVKALPVTEFMQSRSDLLLASKNENPTILHGGTMWAAYQSVTQQFRDKSLRAIQIYSEKLNNLVKQETGLAVSA